MIRTFGGIILSAFDPLQRGIQEARPTVKLSQQNRFSAQIIRERAVSGIPLWRGQVTRVRVTRGRIPKLRWMEFPIEGNQRHHLTRRTRLAVVWSHDQTVPARTRATGGGFSYPPFSGMTRQDASSTLPDASNGAKCRRGSQPRHGSFGTGRAGRSPDGPTGRWLSKPPFRAMASHPVSPFARSHPSHPQKRPAPFSQLARPLLSFLFPLAIPAKLY